MITFYNPGEPVSRENARVGRDAARQLGVQVVERHVGSIEELRLNLQGLKSREVDAYFHTPGALETSQAPTPSTWSTAVATSLTAMSRAAAFG